MLPAGTRSARHWAGLWTFGLVIAVLAGGCASVPRATDEADRAAKAFAPPPGKAGIYVYRPDVFVLSAVTLNVSINGYGFGLVKVGTYLYAVVDPGEYTLVSQSEKEVPVVVRAEAGEDYFFQQEVSFGADAAMSSLVRVDEETGRKSVLESEMAASQSPPAPETSPPGCRNDLDCKGERVCNLGACVDPN